MVFLTGKKEIKYLSQRLKIEFKKQKEEDLEDEELNIGKRKRSMSRESIDKKKSTKVLILELYS